MRFSVLSGEEEKRIHEAALCILEEVGLDVARPSLVAKLKEHGFPTPAADRVLIPRARVEEALKGAPRRVQLGARAADKQAVLDQLIALCKAHDRILLTVTHDLSLLPSFDRVVDMATLLTARVDVA